jgi:hypothetical protein
MGAINTGKVVTGGLLGGLVMNVIDYVSNNYLLMDDWTAMASARNIDPARAQSVHSIGSLIASDFLMGILLVWTYAAMRPRFGPGPKTALYAWFTLFMAVTVVLGPFVPLGLFSFGLFVRATAAALVSTVAAALVGAWAYKEA